MSVDIIRRVWIVVIFSGSSFEGELKEDTLKERQHEGLEIDPKESLLHIILNIHGQRYLVLHIHTIKRVLVVQTKYLNELKENWLIDIFETSFNKHQLNGEIHQ